MGLLAQIGPLCGWFALSFRPGRGRGQPPAQKHLLTPCLVTLGAIIPTGMVVTALSPRG